MGPVIVPEGGLRLVPTLVEDASRRDVAGHVVGVGVDPESLGIELAFEPQGIVDHNLPTQEHHGHPIPEHPGLHGIRKRRGQRLATVHPGEPASGVETDDAGVGGALGPFLPGEVGLEGQLEGLQPADRCRGEILERELHEPCRLGGESLTVTGGQFDRAAGLRIGIGAGTDRDKRDGPWMIPFKGFGGRPGPVTVHRVQLTAQRRAMAGVAHQHRTEFPVRIRDP